MVRLSDCLQFTASVAALPKTQWNGSISRAIKATCNFCDSECRRLLSLQFARLALCRPGRLLSRAAFARRGRFRCGSSARRASRLGHQQGLSRFHGDSGADMSERFVAMATGQRPIGRSALRELGLVQSAGLLAGHHRLPAEGLSDRIDSSGLEGPKLQRSIRRMVSTGDHDPE